MAIWAWWHSLLLGIGLETRKDNTIYTSLAMKGYMESRMLTRFEVSEILTQFDLVGAVLRTFNSNDLNIDPSHEKVVANSWIFNLYAPGCGSSASLAGGE